MTKLGIYREIILDGLASLPPRNRALAIGFILACFFGGISISIFLMFNSLETQENKLEELEIKLSLIKILQEEQEDIQQRVSKIETSLTKNATTDLSAFLEKSANQAGFNPKEKNMQVRDRNTKVDGNMQEKVFTVNLSNLTTEEFSNFLYKTETSGYPLQIQTCTVKTKKRKGEKVLQLTLDIAAYKLLEEEG
jgi:hypothetical protein